MGLDKEFTDAWAVLCYQQRMGLATACPLAPLKGIWPRQVVVAAALADVDHAGAEAPEPAGLKRVAVPEIGLMARDIGRRQADVGRTSGIRYRRTATLCSLTLVRVGKGRWRLLRAIGQPLPVACSESAPQYKMVIRWCGQGAQRYPQHGSRNQK